MLRTYRIGRLFGFPLEVNLTFLIMLGIVLVWWGGLGGLAIMLVAFGSVLLHELGHALVARHLGVPVVGIELHFFGGTAKMMGQPKTSGDEIAIAAAGPAVSFALGGIGLIAGALTGLWAFQLFGMINLVIALFNLIPALPLDGGRIFRALLSRRQGFLRATRTAATVGKAFAIALGAVGVLGGQVYLAFLAVVVWLMAAAEQRNAELLARHGGGFPSRFATGFGAEPTRRPTSSAERDEPAPPEVEVMPRGFEPGAPGPRRPSLGRYVIRRANGRTVIEYVE